MADIDPDKAATALEQLEAKKERRLQAKIDAGEVVVRKITVVCHCGEDVEAATERELAKHPASDGIHDELLYVFTGVPRAPEYWKEQYSTPQVTASSKGTTDYPDEIEAPAGPPLPRPEPTYVKVTIRNGDETDPGQIGEAWYTIEDGLVVLRDSNDKHIASRALLKGVDPAQLARVLLREAEAPKDFQRPIRYSKMGLA